MGAEQANVHGQRTSSKEEELNGGQEGSLEPAGSAASAPYSHEALTPSECNGSDFASAFQILGKFLLRPPLPDTIQEEKFWEKYFQLS